MTTSLQWMKNGAQAALGQFGFRIVRSRSSSGVDPSCRLAIGLDFVLAHYLLRRGERTPLFFIQIGAFDGATDDPLHEYVRRYGWSGVLVEPQARYFSALKRNYADCRGLEFLQVAIANERGTKTMYTLADPMAPELPAWAPQLSSLSLETLMSHRDAIPDIDERVTSELVECITFADLLERVGARHVDLIQIDAEGQDFEILETIDFAAVKPAIVRFESEHLQPREYQAALRLLAGHGYRILPEGFEGLDTTAYLLSEFTDPAAEGPQV